MPFNIPVDRVRQVTLSRAPFCHFVTPVEHSLAAEIDAVQIISVCVTRKPPKGPYGSVRLAQTAVGLGFVNLASLKGMT